MRVTRVLGVLAAFALVACAVATPVEPDVHPAENSLQPAAEQAPEVKFDVDRDLEDKKASFLTMVPCSFCNESISALLEMCKAYDGRSTDHVEEYLQRCTEIGGLQPNKLDLMTTECSDSKQDNSKVNYVYQRRLRCSRIYRSLLQMYAPYDPCLQVRNDFQTNSMTVCQSAWIDCVWNPYGSDGMLDMSTGSRVEFHPPPLTCRRYLTDAIDTCSDMKKFDFYAKSNLKGWCSKRYGGKYQALGCELVISRMTQRDMFMDVCNGLKMWPINPKDYGDQCEQGLKLSPDSAVPLAEYREYMRYIRNLNREPEYRTLLNNTNVEALSADKILYIP
jgi:hypothetical protein